MPEVICFKCGKTNPVLGKVGRRDECFSCRQDLHCCKNCQFYDPQAYNECREPSADVVQDKERSNFCDYYQPGGGKPVGKSAADLLAAAEALFKKKES